MSDKTMTTIEELRKLGAEALNRPWHFQGDAESTLREAREARLNETQAMLDKAKAENRDLLAGEQRKFDSLLREADELAGILGRFAAETKRRAIAPAHQELRGADQRGADGRRELRAMGETLLTEGAVLVPDQQYGQVWDHLAAEAVMLAAGARVVTTDRASVTIPKLSSDSVGTWTAENAEITESSPTMAGIVATPKKLAALVKVSNELIADANPDVVEMIMRQLTRSLALGLDLAAFEGTGTENQPRGLANLASGTITVNTSLGADGSVLSNLDVVAEAIASIETANGRPSAIVMHPAVWGAIGKLKTDTAASRNEPLITAGTVTEAIQRRLFGLPVYLTSQLSRTETRGSSHTCSSIYVCDASQIVCVRAGQMRLELDRSRLFNYDQSEIRGVLRADWAFPNPSAICRIVGVKVS